MMKKEFDFETKATMLALLEDELNELQKKVNDAKAEISSAMTEAGVSEVVTGDYKISYKPVTSTRVDTTALKKAVPELVEKFSKSSTSYRFLMNRKTLANA